MQALRALQTSQLLRFDNGTLRSVEDEPVAASPPDVAPAAQVSPTNKNTSARRSTGGSSSVDDTKVPRADPSRKSKGLIKSHSTDHHPSRPSDAGSQTVSSVPPPRGVNFHAGVPANTQQPSKQTAAKQQRRATGGGPLRHPAPVNEEDEEEENEDTMGEMEQYLMRKAADQKQQQQQAKRTSGDSVASKRSSSTRGGAPVSRTPVLSANRQAARNSIPGNRGAPGRGSQQGSLKKASAGGVVKPAARLPAGVQPMPLSARGAPKSPLQQQAKKPVAPQQYADDGEDGEYEEEPDSLHDDAYSGDMAYLYSVAANRAAGHKHDHPVPSVTGSNAVKKPVAAASKPKPQPARAAAPVVAPIPKKAPAPAPPKAKPVTEEVDGEDEEQHQDDDDDYDIDEDARRLAMDALLSPRVKQEHLLFEGISDNGERDETESQPRRAEDMGYLKHLEQERERNMKKLTTLERLRQSSILARAQQIAHDDTKAISYLTNRGMNDDTAMTFTAAAVPPPHQFDEDEDQEKQFEAKYGRAPTLTKKEARSLTPPAPTSEHVAAAAIEASLLADRKRREAAQAAEDAEEEQAERQREKELENAAVLDPVVGQLAGGSDSQSEQENRAPAPSAPTKRYFSDKLTQDKSRSPPPAAAQDKSKSKAQDKAKAVESPKAPEKAKAPVKEPEKPKKPAVLPVALPDRPIDLPPNWSVTPFADGISYATMARNGLGPFKDDLVSLRYGIMLRLMGIEQLALGMENEHVAEAAAREALRQQQQFQNVQPMSARSAGEVDNWKQRIRASGRM